MSPTYRGSGLSFESIGSLDDIIESFRLHAAGGGKDLYGTTKHKRVQPLLRVLGFRIVWLGGKYEKMKWIFGSHICKPHVFDVIEIIIHNPRVEEDPACGPLIDFVAFRALYPPKPSSSAAHDARVFLEALRRPELGFPHPPRGKYYLVDAGYPQMSGYLGPYKGERYHLPDFRRGSSPRGKKEIFNHRHSSLRCTIERTFAVLKNRWRML
ncbi:hypothetical protein VitviT2T_013728 [Vitis vinifera]|uniref:DDE Tnp4 domain-containing protein n=1 Tax=Vitis vinifera TaxID=29760 RepID=A0ABY9CKD2_VITVI|nr:hypothetical protein VitviT2T_013728 [Vitis vinifera]